MYVCYIPAAFHSCVCTHAVPHACLGTGKGGGAPAVTTSNASESVVQMPTCLSPAVYVVHARCTTERSLE